MKLAIMQPYFLPYIGYFQLISAVDAFIIYDNIQYTKKGWINRNRYLLNGKHYLFTIPLKKDSDYLNVSDRYISEDFDRKKMLNRLAIAYQEAPYYKNTFALIEQIVNYNKMNLFDYIYNSVIVLCNCLGISTKILISSSINTDNSLKHQDKVLAICRSLNAQTYINPIGGIELYSKEAFSNNGIQLKFIRPVLSSYTQLGHEFVPFLSILDVMMFNGSEELKRMIDNYEIE